jgi:hypothetical protein
MNTAFGANIGSSSVSTPSGGDARAVDAENIDPSTGPATSPAEPSSVGGNPSKAIFALRASSIESLNSAMAAEAGDAAIETLADAAIEAPVSAPIVPPPKLDIPALSNQTLEHIKDMPAEPQSKSARNSRPKSAHVSSSAAPARSIESLSARGAGPKNFEEMDKNEARGDSENAATNKNAALESKKKQPMTMMERQELWMAKKKEKADLKKKAKEEAIADSIKPLDVSRSKQSFSLVKAASKLSAAAKSAIAAEKAAANLKAAALARSTAAAKEALAKKGKKGDAGKKKTSLKKVAKEIVDGKKKSLKDASALGKQGIGEEHVVQTPLSPMTAMAKRRNSCLDASIQGKKESGLQTHDAACAKSSSTPNLSSPVPGSVGTGNSGFVKGEFFTRYDESTRRGHLRVRDGSDFQMNTMFRKRDKFSKKGSAVAILVGTRAEKNDEQVIEVLFDTDKMEEEECWAWWTENESRFASPKK